MKKQNGQILVGVIILLLVLSIFVAAMVLYVQNEARWSVKQKQNGTAFELADAAVEKAFRKVSESTGTWNAIQNGNMSAVSSYLFNTSFSDLSGGTYAIGITSGPTAQTVTITAVGRESQKKEMRAIQAVYANSLMGNRAIQSKGGVTVSGANVQVEWGAVVSNNDINTNNRNHPQFWSAGNIIPQDTNGAAPPNNDPQNVQWHSYNSNIPTAPSFDFAYYQASATANGTFYPGGTTLNNSPANCGNSSTCDTGLIYYVDGDATVASPGIYIRGTLIVRGNLTLPNGRSGQGGPTVPLPQQAWKQYGNDWAYYKAGNWGCSVSGADTTPTLPASFPGLTSTYRSLQTINVVFSDSKVMVNGFLYVGGNLTASGGAGQTKVIGAMYVVGTVTLGSNNICVFYTDAGGSAIATTTVILSRQSWQDFPTQGWPGGLP